MSLSRVQLFETPWTVAYQIPLSMGVSRQEYWSGLPFPSPLDHVLSALSTITPPSWVALHGMAYSFPELHKLLRHEWLYGYKDPKWLYIPQGSLILLSSGKRPLGPSL